MGIADQFRNYAMDFAEAAIKRVANLDRRLAELEIERAKIEAERKSSGGALQRLANYPVKIGSDYACPRCWINKDTASPMHGVPSQTNNDLFRCQLCHLDLEIEY